MPADKKAPSPTKPSPLSCDCKDAVLQRLEIASEFCFQWFTPISIHFRVSIRIAWFQAAQGAVFVMIMSVGHHCQFPAVE